MTEEYKTYHNTPSVVVVLIPYLGRGGTSNIVLIQRSDSGKWALPGGFQEVPESYQQAGAREVKEEIGIELDPTQFTLLHAETVPDGKVNLVFYVSEWIREMPTLVPNSEVNDITYVDHAVELAFPIHTKVLRDWFNYGTSESGLVVEP